jgi:hypothetical protein
MDVAMLSLGWNCDPASIGLEYGLRPSRADGYGTGPFDLMMSSSAGLCACLAEDFERFFDLEVRDGEVVNARYGFVFNHESPNRFELLGGDVKWPTPDHFVDNDFEYFRRRYEARVRNFRSVVGGELPVVFVHQRKWYDPTELDQVIGEAWPGLTYRIVSIANFDDVNEVDFLTALGLSLPVPQTLPNRTGNCHVYLDPTLDALPHLLDIVRSELEG